MNLPDCIKYLYPNAVNLQDFVVVDEGNGQQVAYWNTDVLGVMPDIQVLKDVFPEVVTAKQLIDKKREISIWFEKEISTPFLMGDDFYLIPNWRDLYSSIRESLRNNDLTTVCIRSAINSKAVVVDKESINIYCKALATKCNELYVEKHAREANIGAA